MKRDKEDIHWYRLIIGIIITLHRVKIAFLCTSLMLAATHFTVLHKCKFGYSFQQKGIDYRCMSAG
jgi:hypothetical protein